MSGTKKKKRMRLPNGIGSVHQINDGKRRRKPWRARVPSHIEFNAETGKASQKYINIGYYATETEAIEALFEYRKNPYTIEASTSTFADVYDMWSKRKFPTVSKIAQYGYSSSFKHSAAIHDMKMRDIRANHLESIMLSLKGGFQLQSNLKTLWGQLFKYAMEQDIVQKDYSAFVKLRDKAPETNKTAMDKKDIEKIWKEADKGNPVAEITLIYIYTGLRAAELLEVTKNKVDLEKRIMIAGKKTEAGKDRRIPLHYAILPFIEKRMESDSEHLITYENKGKNVPFTYNRFVTYEWNPFMESMKMEYTMHYTRHTFATISREVGIEEDIRKVILGHKSGDITDRYTHYSDEMLLGAIDKLKGR